MSKSILDWDAFDDEDDTIVNKQAQQAAKENLKTLDVGQALDEFGKSSEELAKAKALKDSGLLANNAQAYPAMNAGRTYTPEQLKELTTDVMKRAQEAVSNYNPDLLGSGGRIVSSEKVLLNGTTDLNQLVPFKYAWAWSLYLSSCNNHWMPAEMEVGVALKHMPEDRKGVFVDAMSLVFRAYRIKGIKMSDAKLLNIYRLTTNPECRQYLLRQGMESIAHQHMISDFRHEYQISTPRVNPAIYNILNIVAEAGLSKYMDALDSFELTTEGSKVNDFLTGLFASLGVVNFLLPFVAVANLAVVNKERNLGLDKLCFVMLRDILAQFSYFDNFYTTACLETEGVDNELQASNGEAFLDRLAEMGSRNPELQDVVQIGTEMLYSVVSPNHPFRASVKTEGGKGIQSFIARLRPVIDTEAGLSGTGGSLEW